MNRRKKWLISWVYTDDEEREKKKTDQKTVVD
jgi:hypothetical protein